MKLKLAISFIICIILSFSAFVLSKNKSNFNDEKLPFSYEKKDFGKVKVKQYSKVTADSEAVKASFPVDLPAHTCFELEDKKKFYAFEKGPRYFSPSYSVICFIPTKDTSEDDFKKAYPNFSRALEKLNSLIKEKNGEIRQYKNLIDIPYNHSGWSLKAKVRYLDYENISGVSFLTQYTQELTPNLLNNEELTFNFQGLTKDNKFYVAIRFAITHPSLPKGIDFTDDSIQENALKKTNLKEIEKAVSAYIKKEEEKLESFDEKTFKPSMVNLKRLIKSISIK